MNAYSLADYEEIVTQISHENPQMRLGQAYYNGLARIRMDLAIQVRGERGLDPFISNANIRAFKSWLVQHWEEIE